MVKLSDSTAFVKMQKCQELVKEYELYKFMVKNQNDDILIKNYVAIKRP